MNNLSKENELLTFELDKGGKKLEVHCSQAGLRKLIGHLEQLLHVKGNEHTHMMTSEWGGTTLSSVKQGSDTTLINHVKVFKWE